MYNSQNVAQKIKIMAKLKKVTVKQLLNEVGLGFNTLTNMKTSMPKADNLAKIADYLDCSVDYLLGRTDEPSSTSNVIGGNVTGGAVMQGSHHNNVTVSNNERKLTDEETELLRLFNSLDVKHRVKLLTLGFSLEEEVNSKKSE